MTSTSETPRRQALRRELGRWDLTAIGVNQVIGGAVFALPAALAANTGAWSPWMVGRGRPRVAADRAVVRGGRQPLRGTGGPYLYTRAAFGRFAAFEVGWMLWFTRAASWASVINVLVRRWASTGRASRGGAPRVAAHRPRSSR